MEWYTPICDPKAGEKINEICTVINRALPSQVRILRENLSRTIPFRNNNIYKNSYHLYPLVTLEHNAKSCMRSFVKNNIWSRLKDRQDMWCGRKRKPIVDLDIYTKNRPFRVPGSSKYENYYPIPLPSWQFFLDTRMADRKTKADIMTSQLAILSPSVEHDFCRSKNAKRSLVSSETKTDNSNTILSEHCVQGNKKTEL